MLLRWLLLVAVAPQLCFARGLCFGSGMTLYDEMDTSKPDYVYNRYMAGGEVYGIYENSFTFEGGDHANMVTQASVEALCDAAAVSGEKIVFIDIESWPLTTAADRASTKSRFEQVLQWCKPRLNADQKLGVYSIAPRGDWYRIVQTPNSCCNDTTSCNNACTGAEALEEWQTESAELNFSQYADILMPSLYLYFYAEAPYTVARGFIDTKLTEAKTLCPTCEIVPFIWPFDHGAGDMYASITNISTDNPAVVTFATSEQFQTGMSVYLTGITGSSDIENRPLIVTRINGTSVSLDGIDGSSIEAYGSGGIIHGQLPTAMWRAVLDETLEHTGKAIIFGLTGMAWAENAHWWRETKRFQNCR